jgi:hypothetical protein
MTGGLCGKRNEVMSKPSAFVVLDHRPSLSVELRKTRLLKNRILIRGRIYDDAAK